MRKLEDNTFDTALREATKPLIVKFYANWCPDCRRVEKAYEEFPTTYPDLEFTEVNTEENPDLVEQFDVRGIPSFLVFRGGELSDRLYSRDAKSVKQVEDFITKQIQASV